MKRQIRWDLVLVIVAVICFGAFGVISYRNMQLERNASEVREKIAEIRDSDVGEKEQERKYSTPYDSLFEMNDDMAAWLLIPGTDIDYPVMQTPNDEEYYLYRDFFGNKDKNGTLFIDTDCSLDDERANILIHGHHMKSGAMFGNLTEYEDEAYEKEHSKIYLHTRDEMRVYEVLAVFHAKVYQSRTDKFLYYNYPKFDTKERFDEYYQNIKKMSLYDTGVTAEFGDELITLSTCAYHTKNGRFAVVAKRVQ